MPFSSSTAFSISCAETGLEARRGKVATSCSSSGGRLDMRRGREMDQKGHREVEGIEDYLEIWESLHLCAWLCVMGVDSGVEHTNNE